MKKPKSRFMKTILVATCYSTILLSNISNAYAELSLLCQRKKPDHRMTVINGRKCPNGFIKILDLSRFKGAAGAQGIQGIQGLTGETGTTGAQGIQGIAGANGIDGKSVLNGSVDPSSSIGSDGDFYLNTLTNTFFGPKINGNWNAGVSLVGATGAQGIQGIAGETGAAGAQGIQGIQGLTGETGTTGAQGIQGIQGLIGETGAAGVQGIQGIAGANGIDGKSVLNGSVDPSSSIGSDGDFYLNTSTSTIFGPKINGNWNAGVSLVGATGAQGIQGIQGIAGETGAAGSSEQYFLGNTSTVELGLAASYLAPMGSQIPQLLADLDKVEMPAPKNCTATTIYASLTLAPGLGTSRQFTLYKNGVATALTCTIDSSSTSCQGTDSVAISLGDSLALEVASSGLAIPSLAKFFWICN